MMRGAILVAVFTALSVISGVTGAQTGQSFYRWKDATGATHYSDRPPPVGKASRVKVDGHTPADGAPAPSSTVTKDGENVLEKAEGQARQRNCDNAQANLHALQGNAMLVDSSDLTKAHRMTDDERAMARHTAEGDVRTYCGEAAP